MSFQFARNRLGNRPVVLLKQGRKGFVFQDIDRLILLRPKYLNFAKRIWFEISRYDTFTFTIMAFALKLPWHAINQIWCVPLNLDPLKKARAVLQRNWELWLHFVKKCCKKNAEDETTRQIKHMMNA